MEFGGRHLAALCREIVTLALRLREQQRALDDHAERLAVLETEVTAVRQPPPLRVARPLQSERSAAVDSLTASFEARLQEPEERTD
jgi:hypothetical protein